MSREPESQGQRIARARRRRGLSQVVVAGLIGRSESWLSQVERGKRDVDSYVVLIKLAEVLRVDVDELAAVSIHAIAAALQLGDARTAIETGEALDPAALPPECTGRRTQLSLDLARAYAQRKQDAAAVNMLLAAERLSPQLVRYDARTREVLVLLLRREHQPSTPELRPLARRAGVLLPAQKYGLPARTGLPPGHLHTDAGYRRPRSLPSFLAGRCSPPERWLVTRSPCPPCTGCGAACRARVQGPCA
jgi:transcriptional regulator with XRE-family HTH domain